MKKLNNIKIMFVVRHHQIKTKKTIKRINEEKNDKYISNHFNFSINASFL